MTGQDIYDIAEHLIYKIQDYATEYTLAESPLIFEDYVLSEVIKDMSSRYSRYQVIEAFDSPKIQMIVSFYASLGEEDEQENTIH